MVAQSRINVDRGQKDRLQLLAPAFASQGRALEVAGRCVIGEGVDEKIVQRCCALLNHEQRCYTDGLIESHRMNHTEAGGTIAPISISLRGI